MFNILVVEDDAKLGSIYSTILRMNKYNSFIADNGLAALEILDREYIDLIITDIMMPGMDGFELAMTLRDHGYNMPILMITARESFHDMQKGFLSGTDDYMAKPVNWDEMILRIGALLRRARIVNERRLTCGSTVLDLDSLTVIQENETSILPLKEFLLLFKLISFPGKIFTRQQLMDEIWGIDTVSDERTVDVHINHLRERFKNCNDFEIITVRGLGYKAVRAE
ncbi:MAG: Response regulator consisting of a CheY-like receiver domain and a winged-helix DNA-binding domain [Bacillota bacterium]|jgi:DNA-binding response OmpR family regulator|nr:Response regulator consisting of a CheY-like receiver domain and a winged-helix DNA-binding domain [Bacillota bacterium]